MNSCVLIASPVEVETQLEALQLSREGINLVVEAMHGAKLHCTENDALSASGTRAYLDGVRRIREIFCTGETDWIRHNFPAECIFNAKLHAKISVMNTDAGTGLETQIPQNRLRKGAVTVQAVQENRLIQTELFELPSAPRTFSLIQNWYLCVYSEGEIVRAELSVPEACEDGFFKRFSKRIILPSLDFRGTDLRKSTLPSDDGASEFEIEVTRRSV